MVKVQAVIHSLNYATLISSESGHRLQADEPYNNGGGNSGPTPHELMASALASCTAITLKMYCDLKGWTIDNITVHVDVNPKGRPLFLRRILVKAMLGPDQQKRLLQIANHCPMHKLLTGQADIKTTIS
jgi:putative redox protein